MPDTSGDGRDIDHMSTNTSFSTISGSPSNLSEDRRRKKKRRPLAMAVNYKYGCVAEDESGRPIVITPTGSRTSPIDLSSYRNLQTASTRVLGSSWSIDPQLVAAASLESFDTNYSPTAAQPVQSFSSL